VAEAVINNGHCHCYFNIMYLRPMAATHFLQAIGISKLYPGERVSGVAKTNLTIQQGKITAVIGESGSGKSTLLRLLYGLLTPDTGTVYFKGERIWGPEEKLIPGHDAMKMVTQHTDDLNLFAKVWDNVAILIPNNNLKVKEEKTARALELLNMAHLAEKRVVDLSGGEKQRVALARAIITRPEVLLLDEPFNQVDTAFREDLQQDIRQIVRETGLTVIMVSHDPSEILSMADELIVMRTGDVLESGQPLAVYNNPRTLYTARLLANCNVLDKVKSKACGINLKTKKTVAAIYPEWIKLKTGKDDDWQLKMVLFKGFYEEILLEKNDVILRARNFAPGQYKQGDSIDVEISKWLEY
jgi:ABC-type Fe3+/spermidine/putrescine transport system ATPase subunit